MCVAIQESRPLKRRRFEASLVAGLDNGSSFAKRFLVACRLLDCKAVDWLMWQRRQHKAQRRCQQNTSHSTINAARDKRDRLCFAWFVVGACALVALVALLHDHDEDRVNLRHKQDSNFMTTHILRFLSDYPRRFAAFYAPKLQQLVHWSSSVYQAIEVSDDVTSALDFAVALVVITSVYHIIEIGRRAVLSRFQSNRRSEMPEKNDQES